METDHSSLRPGGENIRDAASGRRWTVLFIGDHGKVIAFKQVKVLIALAVITLLIALVTVAALVVINQRLHDRGRDVQAQLEESSRKIETLSHERDLLMAHVVLVEAKMKETLSGISRPAGERSRGFGASAKTADQRPPSTDTATESPDEDPEAAATGMEARAPIQSGETVGVEGFGAKFDAGRSTLHIQYKLIVPGTGRKPAIGHVIVVFKGEQLEPESWLAMPKVELPKGRPTGQQQGYAFSISNSKAFAQSMPVPKSFPGYTAAVLYVFLPDGQLMLAKKYPVKLQPAGG